MRPANLRNSEEPKRVKETQGRIETEKIPSTIRKANNTTKRLENKGQESCLHLKAGGVHVLAELEKGVPKQKPLWSEWLPGAKRQGVIYAQPGAQPYIRFEGDR